MSKKFLLQAKFNAKGVSGLLKSGGTARRQVAHKMITDLGGNLESLYFTLNSDEVYAIFELPNELSAAAISLNVEATGMAGINLIQLFTPSDIDIAAGIIVDYRPPGQE